MRSRPNFGTLLRAVRYVARHRRLAVLAYGSLFVATAAQLVVPQLVRIIIDSVIGGLQLQADRSLALQSFILLIATLLVLWFSNPALTLVILPILPIAFGVFLFFGAIAQPLFMAVQVRISALNTVLQENVAGLKVVRAFGREPEEV